MSLENQFSSDQLKQRDSLKQISENLSPQLRAQYLSSWIGQSVKVYNSLSKQIETIVINQIDLTNGIVVVNKNGRLIKINVISMSDVEFYKTLLLFENLMRVEANSKFSSIIPLENIPNTLPQIGQQVRVQNGENTIVGTCADITFNSITIEGIESQLNQTSENQSRRADIDGRFVISTQNFIDYGIVINDLEDIAIQSAKPEILGDLQTIEEIAEFVLQNELTSTERSQINDYLIYRKTKPQGYKDILEGQYGKVRFVDGLVQASFDKGQTLDSAVQESKDYILNIFIELMEFKTQKGTVLNLDFNNQREAGQNEIVINLNEFEYREVERYTQRLLEGNNLETYSSAYNLSRTVLIDIDARIKKTSEPFLKATLMKIKKALGIVVQAYFDSIDSKISEEMVLEVENSMRNFINTPENGVEIERGEVRMVMVNGYTGSGKGTTLELLNAKASESGTDGLAGRGEGFEDYEQIMGPYDLARFAGEYIPNKLMRLLFATELINQRAKLDSEGRYTDPVYVSGFPRTDDQAKLFNGVEGIKAVSLNITPETAVFRVVRRMTQNLLLKGKGIRGDDLSDLALKDANGHLLTPEMLTELIRQLNEEENITNVDMITPERVQAITDLLTLSAGARYHRYNSDKPKIEKAMATLGVNVYQIQGDELNPDQVTQIVRDYIIGAVEA